MIIGDLLALYNPVGPFTPGGVIFADANGFLDDDAADFSYVPATGQVTARSYRMANVAAGTADVYLEFDDGQTVPVSAAGEGRIRYNAATVSFEVSENGGPWTDLTVGGTAFVQNGNSFGALAVLGTNDAFGLSLETSGVVRVAIAATGPVTFTQSVATAGSIAFHTLTPAAHTTLSGESPTLVITAVTQQWNSALGAQALLRSVIFNAPTYDMDGAATITTAVNVDITGPPIAGATTAMTNQFGLRVNNTASAAVALTTAAGIQVFAPRTTGIGSVTNSRAIIAGGTATVAFPNGATFNYHVIDVPAHTVTVTNTNMTNAASTASALSLGVVTISSANNINNAATLYIAGAPAMAGGGAVTNSYSLWVDAGDIRSDGLLITAVGSAAAPSRVFFGDTTTGSYSGGAGDYSIAVSGVQRGRFTVIGLYVPNDVYSSSYRDASSRWTISTNALTPSGVLVSSYSFVTTQFASTTGNPAGMVYNAGAHLNLTLSTESKDVLWDMSRTVEFATGALALQRSVVFDVQTTYGFVGGSTATNVAGMHVTAGPTQGANATFTNVYGMVIGGTQAFGAATTTIASSAAMTFSQMALNATGDIVSLTGIVGLTAAASIAGLRVGALTINTTGLGVVVTSVASVYIAGAPTPGALVTLTDTYSLWCDAGIARFDGNGTHVFQLPTAASVAATVTRTVAFKDGVTTYYLMASTVA